MILGAGIMQGPAIRTARDMELETVVIDGNPRAPCAGLADRFECIDLKDKEAIAEFALSEKKSAGLSGVLTAGTDFSATVAWVAERLGLPGIPYETALNASDKSRMRQCFRSAGVPSPAFITLDAVPGAAYELPFPYPAVVKPVDNMGSRGCRKVSGAGELIPAAEDALAFSRSGSAIVESYMEGPEYSVDALVFGGDVTICGLADRHIFFPPYFIEMGHTMPAVLEPEAAAALLDTFKLGIAALGIRNGAAKGDIKLTPSGPMIGEIAARLSGGYMSGWTYPYSSGVNPVRGAIEIALGRAPSETAPVRRWTSAERAFISIPGTVRSIHGAEEAAAIPGIRDVFLRAEPGSWMVFPENNVEKAGNVIAAAETRTAAAAAADRAARSILLRLAAPDQDTDAFLSEKSENPPAGQFPPDAFTLSPEQRSLLARIPDPDFLPAGKGSPQIFIIPFPGLYRPEITDYTGRSVPESIEAVRKITGLPLPFAGGGSENGSPVLGRRFWAALVRGGYQGAAYTVDSLIRNREA
ncbi:ATP-grasp domain-containing protein [Breznakiella homolactica]|uniref:ATP-grasp domain-containing protein n=2 Tax=Breznakiella homolactica TaxID=2798577 RepID=A0A7T8BDN4_9SPIR|nr:ATP-grasp domain-containing protein [Breznakiella homolactica]